MDETDMEAFDRFVERHWGDKKRSRETVSVSASTEKPLLKRRRGRPSKK